MRALFAVIKYTFIENLRNRTIYTVIIFNFIAVFSAMLFSKIAGEQELRIIQDSGLSAIEIFSLMLSVFLAARLVSSEIEGKSLYLIFSKPVKRYQYISGRYAGILLVEISGIIMMALSLFALLLFRKWIPDIMFLWQIIMICLKMVIISAIALFFSLVFTSSATALVSAFFIWLIGHAVSELRYLAEHASAFPGFLLSLMTYLTPNFQIFNLKEYDLSRLLPSTVLNNSLYAFSYAAGIIILSCLVFNRKEL